MKAGDDRLREPRRSMHPPGSNEGERPMTRSQIRSMRERELIADFPEFLAAFTDQPAFSRAGQLEGHQETIRIRRAHASVESLLADDSFIASLHSTLKAWGIGVRASRFADPHRLGAELGLRVDELADLESVALESASASDRDRVWDLIENINIVDNQARIVAMTKTLHHILPDLVPPIDRAYTGTFLKWQIPEFQTRQREIFVSAWDAMQRVAQAVDVQSFVGRNPWNTSTTKVIDNAIVGYCVVRELDTGTSTGKTIARSRPSDLVANRPRRQEWGIPDLEEDLVAFEKALTDAGLKDHTIQTYVGRSETFVRWLAGRYQPRGPNS